MNKVNLNMGIMGEINKIAPVRGATPKRRDMIKQINETLFAEWIKKELLRQLKSYPDGALIQFIEKRHQILNGVMAKGPKGKNNDIKESKIDKENQEGETEGGHSDA